MYAYAVTLLNAACLQASYEHTNQSPDIDCAEAVRWFACINEDLRRWRQRNDLLIDGIECLLDDLYHIDRDWRRRTIRHCMPNPRGSRLCLPLSRSHHLVDAEWSRNRRYWWWSPPWLHKADGYWQISNVALNRRHLTADNININLEPI